MTKTCDYLKDKTIDRETIKQASEIAISEISPISDIRGSKEYKSLLVNHFIYLHFKSLFPERITGSYYET